MNSKERQERAVVSKLYNITQTINREIEFEPDVKVHKFRFLDSVYNAYNGLIMAKLISFYKADGYEVTLENKVLTIKTCQ